MSDLGDYGPPQHVKITDHFARQASERLPEHDVMALWFAILDGRLGRAVLDLRRGERGVAAFGSSYVVFAHDEDDPGEVALLTVLDPDKAHVIGRRRDTRLLDLGVGSRVEIKADPEAETYAFAGVDDEGEPAVRVIGGTTGDQGFEIEMTVEEAERLHRSLGRLLRRA